MDSNKTTRVIEIGATYTRRADVSFDEKINNFITVPTSELLSSKNILEKFIKFVGQDFKKEIAGISYAVAGPVNDRRIIEFLPNVPSWPKNLDLVELTNQKLKIPSIVLNDMEAAVTGMAAILYKKENFKKPFWGITWSSGIGGRFWDGKRIVSDSEIGHITLDNSESAPLCGCGKRGHTEAFLSGKSIEKILQTDFGEKIGPENKNPFEIVNKAYLEKENWAIDLYQEKARLMGIFLSNLVQINPCERIYFKGKVAANVLKFPGIKEKILESIQKSVVSPAWAVKEILLSPEGEKDALIGASIISQKYL